MMKSKKTILICALALALLLAVGAPTILAYFTDMDSVNNHFTVGENTIQIVYNDQGKVVVENTKSVDCYIRVFVKPENPDTQMPVVDTTNWTAGPSGYYYYKDPVKPGDTTKTIFVNPETEDNAEGLVLYAESIQAEAIITDTEGVIDAFTKQ